MINKNTLPTNFLGCESCFDDSDIVIFGAPFDGTTTFRPGTRFAPSAMRIDSIGLETYSPYFDADISDYKIHDYGDLDLPFGSPNKALEMISQTSRLIFENGKKPLMIGGEHLVSLPSIEQAAKIYPELRIIHFDAHTDLREEYIGEPLSHSTVIRRAWDILGDNRIYQFGIRSGTREEFYWAKDGHTNLCLHNFDTLSNAVSQIGTFPIYLTIDLDVLDPSIFSGTGTPEAGGVTFLELINALKKISTLNIIGADVVELSPHYDHSGASTAVACKVLREVILTMQNL
ncbi:agmatinase [Ruminiclostridium josui]|uniref:agmatinase n=1 Tax=Ruminiclostridium josui TaxID=1499 RepID=UPI000463A47C|nr:agmatinase [Ruminiclostridium josui]